MSDLPPDGGSGWIYAIGAAAAAFFTFLGRLMGRRSRATERNTDLARLVEWKHRVADPGLQAVMTLRLIVEQHIAEDNRRVAAIEAGIIRIEERMDEVLVMLAHRGAK